MSLEVIELVVKCQVPVEESEEYVVRLRSGEPLLNVPDGFTCLDAFETYEPSAPATAVIRAGYRPK